MILLSIGIVLFLIIAGLLILPFSVVADSNQNTYFISIPFYLKGTINKVNEEWKFRIRVFLIPVYITGLKRKRSIKQQSETEKKPKKRKFNIYKISNIIRGVNRSFRIKRLNANIDTGDYPLNAQLIPVVTKINSTNIAIRINFEDTNSIYLNAVTHLYKIIWIVIRYIIF